MEGFEAYDFDGDERWTQYVARVEVAGVREGKETQTRGMRLLRAKWYKLNVDQDFDVDAVRRVGAAQASSGANSRQQAPQPPPTRPAAPRSQASVSSRASAGERSMRVAILTRREVVTQVMMFVMNMALLLTGALSLVPVAKISQRCFTWALQLAAGSHAVKLFNTTGMLSLRPFPSSPLAWMQRAAEYTDCHYMSLALVFLMGRPFIGVLLPLAVAATYDAFAYASHNLSSNILWRGYGSRLHRWLNDNKQQAMLLSAVSEVSLGFLTLFGLLSPARSFTQVILTWNILKQRYRCRESAWYHRQVWSRMDEKLRPYYSHVSVLQLAVAKARQWFQG